MLTCFLYYQIYFYIWNLFKCSYLMAKMEDPGIRGDGSYYPHSCKSDWSYCLLLLSLVPRFYSAAGIQDCKSFILIRHELQDIYLDNLVPFIWTTWCLSVIISIYLFIVSSPVSLSRYLLPTGLTFHWIGLLSIFCSPNSLVFSFWPLELKKY